jgi:hypothetical protein
LSYCYDIRSERRLREEVHLNLAYRWFCRLGLDGEVPDHSTFNSLSLAGLARRPAPGAGHEPPQIFVKRRFRQCRYTSICQVRPTHADHARSRTGIGPGSEGLAGIRRNTDGLYQLSATLLD